MKSLYLWLVLGSFAIPFLFSFHPKIKFYKKWPAFFLGVFVMLLFFIPWDHQFVMHDVWGFNSDYILGYNIYNLPIEEWLFFICIPYACVFTHYALTELLPKFRFSEKATQLIYILLLTTLILVLWYRYDRLYTLVNFVYAIFLLGITYNYHRHILPGFFATYLIILIPFFAVNGILTGSFIDEQVVWYNNLENLGIRIGTIPIEDIIYNLGMLLTVVLVMEMYQKRKSRTTTIK